MSATAVLNSRELTRSSSGLGVFTRRHPLSVFFVLVFALTWLIEIPWIAGLNGWLPFQVPDALLIVMGWMPGTAAVLVTGVISGRAGIRALLGRLRIWRVGLQWYLMVLAGLVVQFLIYFLVNSEELAWRGFALPRLQARHTALVASVMVGTVEGIFHLPLFFKPGTDQAAAGLPIFVVGSIAGAIVFGWLFNSVGGSVLLVMLFHSLTNTWVDTATAPASEQVIGQWLFNGLLVLCAVVIVIAFGPARLSREPASELPVVNDAR